MWTSKIISVFLISIWISIHNSQIFGQQLEEGPSTWSSSSKENLIMVDNKFYSSTDKPHNSIDDGPTAPFSTQNSTVKKECVQDKNEHHVSIKLSQNWTRVDFYVSDNASLCAENCFEIETIDSRYHLTTAVWNEGWNNLLIRRNEQNHDIEIKSTGKFWSFDPKCKTSDININCLHCFANCDEDYRVFCLSSGYARSIPIFFANDEPIFSLWSPIECGAMTFIIDGESNYLGRQSEDSNELLSYTYIDKLKKKILFTFKENQEYKLNWTPFENGTAVEPSYSLVTFSVKLDWRNVIMKPAEKVKIGASVPEYETYFIKTRLFNQQIFDQILGETSVDIASTPVTVDHGNSTDMNASREEYGTDRVIELHAPTENSAAKTRNSTDMNASREEYGTDRVIELPAPSENSAAKTRNSTDMNASREEYGTDKVIELPAPSENSAAKTQLEPTISAWKIISIITLIGTGLALTIFMCSQKRKEIKVESV